MTDPGDRVTPVTRRVAVVGAGYVGMPTAVTLATFGHHVVVAERDEQRRESLRRGISPMVEEGLDDLLARTQHSGRLRLVASAGEAVVGAEVVFFCVATPTGADGRADLSDLDGAVREVTAHLVPGAIAVTKSTVPVGAAERVIALLAREDVAVVSNPEFLREGHAVRDSLQPDRIVVGSARPDAAAAVAALYPADLAPVIVTSARTAELMKYAANGFLATKLSYANSLAQLCDALGADVATVTAGMGLDRRIGAEFLVPGPGWGGSCLPKDMAALVTLAAEVAVDLPVVRAAAEVNAGQPDYVVGRLRALLGRDLTGARVAAWGLTFKARTGDRRASPALAVASRLIAAGATVVAYDPTVRTDDDGDDLTGITLADSLTASARGADVIVVLTEWPEFGDVDWADVSTLVAQRLVLDTRGVVDGAAAAAAGVTVARLGRP